ncbi:hypothetical protein AAES_92848 [Amazona aestiva]|uniref:Uncharacterized protein n=1 Tax=Amazona aestiva TaxID=12930 RepID=A0A0Q3TJE7_AMAAE|nr:hypothetical protein AAES_92848 [Amazona aestiva]
MQLGRKRGMETFLLGSAGDRLLAQMDLGFNAEEYSESPMNFYMSCLSQSGEDDCSGTLVRRCDKLDCDLNQEMDIISESSGYSHGEPVTFVIPQRSLPEQRRNVKVMTQLFLVIDGDNRNKNPLNFKYSEKKFRIQK